MSYSHYSSKDRLQLTGPEDDEVLKEKAGIPGLEMPPKLNFDFSKYLPWLLIIGGWVLTYGKSSNQVEMLRLTVDAQIQELKEMRSELARGSERLAKVETQLEDMKITIQTQVQQQREFQNRDKR